MSRIKVGIQNDCFLVLGNGFFDSSLLEKGLSVVAKRDVIVFCDLRGMTKESFAILPKSDLTVARKKTAKKNESCADGENSCSVYGADPIGYLPCQHDENSDQGQICVTIRHLLHAHLHESYDRHQHADVPEPTYRQMRRRAESPKGPCSNQEQRNG